MPRPKKIIEEEEEVTASEPVEIFTSEPTVTGIESHPEYDPNLPESKQRHLR